MSDGRIVVVDGGEDRLAVIDPGTDTVGVRFGRVGQGPRELSKAAGRRSFRLPVELAAGKLE